MSGTARVFMPLIAILLFLFIYAGSSGDVLPEGEIVRVRQEKMSSVLQGSTPVEMKILDYGWGEVILKNPHQVLEIWNALQHMLPDVDSPLDEREPEELFTVRVTFLNGETREFSLPREYLQQQNPYSRSVFQ